MLNDPDGKNAAHNESMEGTGTASSINSKPQTWSRRFQGFRNWVCVSKNIDWVSRRVFPSAFALFNLIYWSIYLSPPYYHCGITDRKMLDACIQTAVSPIEQ